MSYFTYNDIDMEVESFQRFDQVAIYSDDGADYLYTEFTIVVRAFWHPKGIASAANATAATSMNALRASLLTPRKQLIISSPLGGDASSTVFLKSPLGRPSGGVYATDAKLGPQPLFCNIQQIIGEESMIVDFGITTWVNECPGSSGSPVSPTLSHRWSMAHYIDEMQHTKRLIAGTAIFRSDQLYDSTGALLVRADDFRDFIFHNVPINFRRIAVNVNASSDGTRLEYSIEDQEVDGVLNREIHTITEVAHIEGTYTEATEAGTGIKLNDAIEGGFTGAALGGVVGTALGSPAGGVVGASVGAVAGAASGIFPTKYFEVNVRVQGTRRSTRTGLVLVAIRAAAGFRIGSLGQPAAPNAAVAAVRALAELFLVSNSVTVGLVEKWVQLRLTYRTGGISSIIHQLIGALAPGAAQVAGALPLPTVPTGIIPLDVVFGITGQLAGLAGGPATTAFQATSDTPNVPLPIPILNNPSFPDELAGVTKSNGTPLDSYGPHGGSLAFGVEKGSRGATIAHLVTAALGMPCTPPATTPVATALWNNQNLRVNWARRTS